ncbi:carbohydrate esterase family 3 protein [Xylariomycetidae sp. FL2044]|nr:carbohydrate esterase family 3 protein [Xylariomycetidae sp. FL2044]
MLTRSLNGGLQAWQRLPGPYRVVGISVLALCLLASIFHVFGPEVADVQSQWHKLSQGGGGGGGGDGQPFASGMPIRLMYLGASVTLGEHSEGDRGYRSQVRSWLAERGNPVNCVGDNRFGTGFVDNDVQAFGAQPIAPTLERARDAVRRYRPNLVLVNAGSSDCFQEDRWGARHTYADARALMEFLLAELPDAVLVMSTVVPCRWEATERGCVKGLNAQLRQVYADLVREDPARRVAFAEMHEDQGLPGRPTLEHDIGPDDMHPTTEGYFMMGRLFIEQIVAAEKKGWFVPPVENGIWPDGVAEREAQEAQEAAEKLQGKQGGGGGEADTKAERRGRGLRAPP